MFSFINQCIELSNLLSFTKHNTLGIIFKNDKKGLNVKFFVEGKKIKIFSRERYHEHIT
ncbi:hypothetical protein LCGC14_1475860, partial [marine sediment metagenome]